MSVLTIALAGYAVSAFTIAVLVRSEAQDWLDRWVSRGHFAAAIALAVLAFAVDDAEARPIVWPDPDTPHAHLYQGWANKVPSAPDMVVRVSADLADCTAPSIACAHQAEGRIVMGSESTRTTFVHELGHLFDWWYLTDANRKRFSGWFRISPERWSDWTLPPRRRGEEKFADLYVICSEPRRQLRMYSGWRRYARWCRHIRRIYRRGPVR